MFIIIPNMYNIEENDYLQMMNNNQLHNYYYNFIFFIMHNGVNLIYCMLTQINQIMFLILDLYRKNNYAFFFYENDAKPIDFFFDPFD